MQFLRRNLPCILVVALYLLCIVAANPLGEFPLNDDWSYTRSAFAFGSGKGLKVDEWAAPSLLGQALYGGLLTRLFSPHFLVLRISTLLLSCATVILLWASFLRIGFRRDLACVMLLAWIFNPLQFNLSFTFMTEIPFLFFVALAIYLYILHLDTQRTWPLVFSAAALGYAFLIRQTAMFFILALICSLLTNTRIGIPKRIRQCILAAACAGFFVVSYGLWILIRGGSTAAVHRKFELLHHLVSKQIMGNAYGMLFYLSFMLLPVWLFLIPSLYRMARHFNGKIRIVIPIVWSVFVAAGLWWFPAHCFHAKYLPSTAYHARMPFLLNVLYDTGLGPITLEPDYFGPPPTPIYPHAWIAVTVVVAAGALFSGLICTFGLIRRRTLRTYREQRPLFVLAGLAFLCIVLFEITFSHLQEGGIFDRHILIPALPFCLLLGLFSNETAGGNGIGKARAPALLAAGIAIAALSAFCTTATHDYMEWNRVRWEMGESLLGRGVDPLTVVGGFEFNAWHNYDTFMARGDTANVHHWWYDRIDYVITMSPPEGYQVLQKKEYYSWVHRRPIPLYLIRDSRFEIRN